jgi:hypothetical protein
MTQTTTTPSGRRVRTRTAAAGLIAATAACGAVALPTAAQANTYGVIQCGDVYGNGGPALNGVYPFKDGSYGFQPYAHYGQGGRLDDCASDNTTPYGRGLVATLTGTWGQAAANGAAWRFNAAPDTTVTRYGARYRVGGRGFDGASGTSADIAIWHEGQSDPIYDFRDNRLVGPGLGAEQTIDKSIAGGAGYVIFNVGCGAVDLSRTCPAGPTDIGQMSVQGYQAVINDDSNPQVSNVSGDLATSTTWRGTLGVSANLTDKGSGVYQLVFQKRSADGTTWSDINSQVVDTNGGKCVPVSDAKVFDQTRIFAYAQPCRKDASGDYDVDTTKLTPGTGTYRVLVEDAAGNRTTLIGAASRTVTQAPDAPPSNPGPGTTTVVVTTPSNSGTGVPNPPAQVVPAITAAGVPKYAGSQTLLQCSKKKLALTEVLPSGGKDVVRGVADSSYVGQKVSIKYVATGKTVARPTVGVDGTFAVTVKAPKGKVARGNLGRYTASINSTSSAALKRVRRMYTSTAYRTAGANVYLSGRVTKPFPAGAKVTVQIRKTCGTWRSSKSARITSSGAFGVSVPVANNVDAVVVRVQGVVKATAKSKATSRTYTMPTAIQLR